MSTYFTQEREREEEEESEQTRPKYLILGLNDSGKTTILSSMTRDRRIELRRQGTTTLFNHRTISSFQEEADLYDISWIFHHYNLYDPVNLFTLDPSKIDICMDCTGNATECSFDDVELAEIYTEHDTKRLLDGVDGVLFVINSYDAYRLRNRHRDTFSFEQEQLTNKLFPLKEGELIDARESTEDKWYEARIAHYKKANEPMPSTQYLTLSQQMNLASLQQYEAVLVHFSYWDPPDDDEWIFVKPNETVCTCYGRMCTSQCKQHRVAAYRTQTVYQTLNSREAWKHETVTCRKMSSRFFADGLLLYGYWRSMQHVSVPKEIVQLCLNYYSRDMSVKDFIVDLLKREEFANVPFVFVASKQDIPTAVSCKQIRSRLDLDTLMEGRKWCVYPYSAADSYWLAEKFVPSVNRQILWPNDAWRNDETLKKMTDWLTR